MMLTKTMVRFAMLSSALAALPLFAQEGGEGLPPPQGMFGGNFMFIMIAMFAIIYFVMIRPEKRKQKERQAMLSALKKGDKVVTIGGVMGVITAVKDTSYIIKTGEGASIEFTKSAVSNVLTGDKAADAKTASGGEGINAGA